jgi:glycosyltransferase involved in cell wall biosynthesis
MVITQMSDVLPTITALLPARDGERYLYKLIPQILAMLRENDELLVVNDGSVDNSAFLLENLSLGDSRIRVLTTKGVGLVKALNLGIESAKHPWIARFDVDDEYTHNRINIQRQMISDGVVAIFSDYSFISSYGFWLGSVPSAITSNQTKLSLVSSQRTPHPVALVNKACVLSVGGYRVEDFPAEDLGLWCRMIEQGEFLSAPTVLLGYRLRGGSISNSNRTIQSLKRDQIINECNSWEELTTCCIEEFASTIHCYLEQKNPTARVILHLRDIFKSSRYSHVRISTFKLLADIPLITLIKMPFVLMDILVKTFLRRIYRILKTI